MALMDEFKEERESIKRKPLKKKIEYVWEYYKWPIVGVVAAVLIVGSFIYDKVTEKDEAVYGMLLNINQLGTSYMEEDYEALSDDFINWIGLDPKKNEVVLEWGINYYADDTYSNSDSALIILARLSAKQVDFMTGDADAMIELTYSGYFADLSQVLTEEDYETYEPYLLYMDYAIIEKQENGELTETEEMEYPDATDPSSMEDPIPVLLDVSKCETLQEIYGYSEDAQILFAIPYNAPHEENVTAFFKYLMEE